MSRPNTNKEHGALLCCYCGIRKATTKDHIPPKSIFNKPRPVDLITVPCCLQCNNEASVTDEKFKVYLGMHVARQGGEAERLFKEGVLATTKKNKKLSRAILHQVKPVYMATKSGIITGKAKSVPWDNEAHDVTIERITKGLFYHHFNKIISKNVYMKTYWFKEPIIYTDNSLYTKSIAHGAFSYEYNKVDDMDVESVWLYNFYRGHFAGCITSAQIII